MKRVELSQDEWKEIFHLYRKTWAAFYRVGGALLLTEPAKVFDKWVKIEDFMDWKAMHLADMAHDQFWQSFDPYKLIRDSLSGEGDETKNYRWNTRKDNKKRDLTREEWVMVGDDVKLLRSGLMQMTTFVCRVVSKSESRHWTRMVSKVDRLKSFLEGSIHKQHPDWDRVSHVMYGSPSKDVPMLLATLKSEREGDHSSSDQFSGGR